MKALLVEDETSARRATAALCASLGHEVEAVESAEQAMAVLERGGVDLLFTDLVLPKKSGLDLVKSVRTQEKDSHLYVLLLTAKEGIQTMDAAFSAGVDDFVTKGASRLEIAARFRVAERIVRVERQMKTRALELERALRRLEISAAMRGRVDAGDVELPPSVRGPEMLESARTWQSIESTLRAVLDENVHLSFSLGAHHTWAESALASRIALTDIEHKVQLDLFLVAEPAAARAMALSIFGDPDVVDDAVVSDTMLELANGAMGALKAAFASDEYKFTPGIPKHVPAGPAPKLLSAAKDKRVLTFVAGDAVVSVLVGVHEKQYQKVKAKALKDGMVLAENVLTASGAMLLKAGTRLAETHIERLQNIDPNLVVELADPE